MSLEVDEKRVLALTLDALELQGTAIDKLRDEIRNLPEALSKVIAENTASVRANTQEVKLLVKYVDDKVSDLSTANERAVERLTKLERKGA